MWFRWYVDVLSEDPSGLRDRSPKRNGTLLRKPEEVGRNWPFVGISQLIQESIPGAMRLNYWKSMAEDGAQHLLQLPVPLARCPTYVLELAAPGIEIRIFQTIGESSIN